LWVLGDYILSDSSRAAHGSSTPLVATLLEPGHSPVGSWRSLLAKQCFALPGDSGLRPSALRANADGVVQNRSRGFVTATVAHPAELRAHCLSLRQTACANRLWHACSHFQRYKENSQ